MIERLAGSEPLGRVQLKQRDDQMLRVARRIHQHFVQFGEHARRVARLVDPIQQTRAEPVADGLQIAIARRRQSPDDAFHLRKMDESYASRFIKQALTYLLDGAAAWEQRLAPNHLAEDAAQAPHVDAFGVRFIRDKDFRRSVPARCHVICETGLIGVSERAAFVIHLVLQR